MSGMSHLEPKFRGMSRRNNAATLKVEEGRLQKLLDFIDNRMQDQRTKLKRQIEDTQQSAEEMEERRHKATLQVLRNYFEVTSGRIRAPSQLNHIHEERLSGVLSEPSLATVPEVDPDILAKPRSMYDRLTRTLDTSRLPLIAPKNRALINQKQSVSFPASIPNSNRSDESSTPRVILTPRVTPNSTPKNSESDSVEENPWNDVKASFPIKKDSAYTSQHSQTNVVRTGNTPLNDRSSPLYRNGHRYENDHINNYDYINGHTYQKGFIKPTSRLNVYLEDEPEQSLPRLGDMVASKRGLSRHMSLKRPMKPMSTSGVSIASMSDLQPTRKQQAANKLKHALKGGPVRIQR